MREVVRAHNYKLVLAMALFSGVRRVIFKTLDF